MILIMLILIIIIYFGQTKDNTRERFLKLFLYHLSITIRFLLHKQMIILLYILVILTIRLPIRNINLKKYLCISRCNVVNHLSHSTYSDNNLAVSRPFKFYLLKLGALGYNPYSCICFFVHECILIFIM